MSRNRCSTATPSSTAMMSARLMTTEAYWAEVRKEWDAAIAAHGGVTVEEEAQTGTVISARLLTMGTEITGGELTEAAAVKEARSLIRDATNKRPVESAARKTPASAEY